MRFVVTIARRVTGGEPDVCVQSLMCLVHTGRRLKVPMRISHAQVYQMRMDNAHAEVKTAHREDAHSITAAHPSVRRHPRRGTAGVAKKGARTMAAKGKTVATGPAHPGVSIADTVLEKLGLTQDQLAKLTGVSRRTINQLVNFRRNLTADMALRIAKVTGTNAREWLEQQIAYDLHQTELALSKILSKIPYASSRPATPAPKAKAAPMPKKVEAKPAEAAPVKAPKKAAAKKAAEKPVVEKAPAKKAAAPKKAAAAKKEEVKKDAAKKPAPKKAAKPAKAAAVPPAPVAVAVPLKVAPVKVAPAKAAPAKKADAPKKAAAKKPAEAKKAPAAKASKKK